MSTREGDGSVMTRTPEDVRADKERELWGTVDDHHGPVAYMAKHRVAANLLLVFVIIAGLMSLGSLVQEVFPEFSLDTILISVPYPGATPDEIEESILLKIEEQVVSVEGIDEIISTADEGLGTVRLELELGADIGAILDDVKAEVDRITTFPVDAERPEIRELTTRQSVIKLAIFGDVAERTLKEIAYRTEDALSELDAVSYVETTGIRQYEISIEVDQNTLRALGLTLGDVSRVVRQGSLDLSAGSIETRDEQVRIRTLGQNYEQQDFESIVVISRPDGTVVRLGDIATVIDGFEDADLITRYNGLPAAIVEVYRTSDERVLEIVDAIEASLAEDIIPGLPEGVSLEVWNNDGGYSRGPFAVDAEERGARPSAGPGRALALPRTGPRDLGSRRDRDVLHRHAGGDDCVRRLDQRDVTVRLHPRGRNRGGRCDRGRREHLLGAGARSAGPARRGARRQANHGPGHLRGADDYNRILAPALRARPAREDAGGGPDHRDFGTGAVTR